MTNRASSSFPLRNVFLVVCAAAIVLTGCRSGGSRDDASVRLINASAATDDLSVSVDGQRVWKHSTFRSNTGFQGVGEGTYQVNIEAQVNGTRLTGRNYLQCQKGKAYTVVAIGQAPNSNEPPSLRIFNEDRNTPVPANKVRLRFINAGDGTGPVDVLFNSIVGFADVPAATRTQALLLDPGVYGLKVDAANDLLAYAGPVSLRFLPGRAYTLVAMGKPGPGSPPSGVSLEAYPDDQ